MNGKIKITPHISSPVVDIRDVAIAHVKAMKN